ncbi:MAG: hypothetical protein PUD92_07100, partial [Clostridiales bacterium]|nr:hypothetical protein [Clostridiales bacterium]
DKDYIAASYKDGVLVQCKILRKNELLTTSSAEISISGANRLKVFAWNSVEAMTPAAGVTELNK